MSNLIYDRQPYIVCLGQDASDLPLHPETVGGMRQEPSQGDSCCRRSDLQVRFQSPVHKAGWDYLQKRT